MLRLRSLCAVSMCLGLAVTMAAQEMHAPAKSTPAFDQLKSLAGEWQGQDSRGTPVKVSYKVISHGSVLMESLHPGTEPEMVTMYTMEGDRLVVTHYCSAGNQPTMRTEPLTAATGKYDFSFVRVAGTHSPDEGHMAALRISLPDKDHLTQTWTFQEQGKSSSDTFSYTRVK